MTSVERRAAMDETGIPFMSLYSIEIQTKQLGRDGLSKKQIRAALSNLHPKLFENLTLNADGSVSMVDTRLKWARRRGWIPR